MLNLSLFTFICAVGAVIVSVLLMLEYKWTRPRKFFKRPPGLPIAGHIMLFEPSCFLTDVKRKIKEYGSFLQLNVFGDTYLVVTDPATIKEALLKRPKTFRRPRLFEAPFNTLGLWPHSLFVAEGSIWNRLRKATAAPFNKQNVGNMGPSIAAEIANSMIRIESKAGEIIGWYKLMKSMQFFFELIIDCSYCCCCVSRCWRRGHAINSAHHHSCRTW